MSEPTAQPAGGRFGRALFELMRSFAALIASGVRRIREWNRRDGAGASGLAQLVEVHALQSAGDATVAVALAGSLFFSVPTHEARSRVALYLLITMAPFSVVAPILGPLLDRLRHGRRIAIAVTMFARAALAVVIGHSLSGGVDAITLYPAALGVLVAGKAYTIARAAAVPRLVPEQLTLVQANARLTLTGVIAPGIAGAFAAAVVKTLGHTDELLLGAAVYVVGAIFAFRLPSRADGGGATESVPGVPRPKLRGVKFPLDVRHALTAAGALRWLSGFLLLYGAFVVREHPLHHLSANISLGALAVGIGAGNMLGVTVGARAVKIDSGRLGTLLLAVTAAVAVLAAISFSLVTAVGLAVVGSSTAAMTKLSLDATIQERVDDAIRTSTFARSETAMQLAWVVGGVVGILLPTNPRVGFGVAAVFLLASLVFGVIARQRTSTPAAPTAQTSEPV